MQTHVDQREWVEEGTTTVDMQSTGFKSLAFIGVSITIIITGLFYTCADVGVTNDDAYIFYRYARHFVELGEFSYNPGEITYGYSSFLWVLILGVGSLITSLSPVAVAKICLVLLLWSSAVFIYLILNKTLKSERLAALGMLIYAHDPFITMHVYDGMGSGLLLASFASVIWFYTVYRLRRPFILGLLIGLSFLVRPEMILLGPALFLADLAQMTLDRDKDIRAAVTRWIKITIGAALFVVPYTGYMHVNTGSPIPQTYVGKVLTHNPKFFQGSFLERNLESWKINSRLIKNLFTRISNVLLGFYLMVFLPLFTIPVVAALKRRKILWIVPFYLFAGALFLSHYYKFPTANWRYYISIYPIAFLGLSSILPGLSRLEILTLKTPLDRSRWVQVCAGLMVACMLFVTWPAYSQHRSAHEFEKLRVVGHWLKTTVPPETVLAFDMIGAIGYTSEVEIFDLCGLIDPVMWPCQINRSKTRVILDVFKERGVTHIAQYELHISARPYIQALKKHLKPVGTLRIGPGKSDIYRLFEICYENDETRQPVVTGLLQSNE